MVGDATCGQHADHRSCGRQADAADHPIWAQIMRNNR